MRLRHPGPAARISVRAAALFAAGLAALAAGGEEIETLATTPPEQAESPAPLNIQPSLAGTFTWTSFSDDDMHDTYDGLPAAGLEAQFALGRETQAYVSVEYGQATGDPFYDTASAGAVESRLRVVPMTIGLKLNASRNARVAAYLGVGAQLTWAQEETPAAPDPDGPQIGKDAGWGEGLVLSFGPEWRHPNDRLGVGLEVSWGGSEIHVGKGSRKHGVNTVGTRGRVYVTWRL